MTYDLSAVYENGGFRLMSDASVPLVEGALVQLTVQPVSEDKSQDVLALAAKVYEGLTDEDIADVERIAMDRSNFFSKKPAEAQ